MQENTDDVQASPPFGMQLYCELKRLGIMSILNRRLLYAQIQALKKADREGVIAIFPSATYALRKLLRTASPEEIGQVLLREKEKGDMAVLFILLALS